MKKLKAMFYAISLTKWFFIKSWSFIVTSNPKSKIEYFKGVMPAWFRFIGLVYHDYDNLQQIKNK